MANRKPAKRKASAKPAPWSWFLVEAIRTDAGRFRDGTGNYPYWWVRLHSVIGKTPVESQYKRLDVPINHVLRVLVRAPGWTTGIGVTIGRTLPGELCPAEVKCVGPSDPRTGGADMDSEFYNIETVLL